MKKLKLTIDDILQMLDPHELDKTPECPSDIELAQYYANVLPEEKHKNMYKHVQNCNYCSQELKIIDNVMKKNKKLNKRRCNK